MIIDRIRKKKTIGIIFLTEEKKQRQPLKVGR